VTFEPNHRVLGDPALSNSVLADLVEVTEHMARSVHSTYPLIRL
jgi:hypothetical protein